MKAVVVDTNVYISALVFGGTPRMVFERIDSLGYRLCVSKPIMDEVAEVLTRRFGWSGADLRRFLPPLWRRCFIITPTAALEICDDPDDDRILKFAQAADADFIVTGDDDLLRLKHFGSTQIVRPRDFVDAQAK